MCDLSIILLRGDVRERIMNDVVQVVVDGKSIKMTSNSRSNRKHMQLKGLQI
jgi:predicted RNA-binding protein